MKNKDINKLQGIKEALEDEICEEEVDQAIIIDPAREVENSLVSFVTYKFAKARDAVSFEENIKEAILARIGEATFSQLIALLSTAQKGSIDNTNSLLAPFMDNTGSGRTLPENLRNSSREKNSIADDIFEGSNDKAMLQAFTSLSQIIDHVVNVQGKQEKQEPVVEVSPQEEA